MSIGLYKLKKNTNKSIKAKARLVVKGFTQRYGVDYAETFSPVMRYTCVRFLALAASKKFTRWMQLLRFFKETGVETYVDQLKEYIVGAGHVPELTKEFTVSSKDADNGISS